MIKKLKSKQQSVIEQPMYSEPLPTGIFSLRKLIRVMRLTRGLTQKQLADELQTCRQHVQKWEYGQTKPCPENMARILNVLKYEPLQEVISEFYQDRKKRC